MASSTNKSPRKIARQSSLLGTIKNIVAAPLTWLAGAESDDNDHSDSTGKRRRLEPVSEAVNVDDGDGNARVKRMRVHSPPAAAQPSAYLDPPSAAFHQYRPKHRTPALPLARSSSVSANTLDPSRNVRRNLSRATLSPIRLGRTMSIDPPLSQLHISRDTSMHDVVMESGQGTLIRERSLPAGALTARPSFRMRTSITPQPQREVSEPPALNSLILNPTFVRPPPAVQEESRLPTTLGSLVETVRSAKSPVRQHSSLLFATAQPEPIQQLVQQAAVQKALHELDIYKTPLVPTRLRTANNPIASTSSDIPAMFKSRRSSQLVLMDDDRRSEKAGKKGRSQKSPHRNDSKPYAGAGGMKKLLARRKQEVVEKEEKGKDDEMDGTSALQVPLLPPASTNAAAAPIDWFTAASAGTTLTASGSSLRVGRNKTSRNHIERPAARGRHKFSAVYEEEDDSMDPDEEVRRQERAALEEAAKKIPAFEIPAGFSFAKPDAKPLQQDLTNAKEPPITSLPFSFAKPLQLPEPSKTESSQSRKENSEASTASTEKGPELLFGLPQLPTPSLSDTASLGSAEWGNERNVTAPPAGLGSGSGGVPNFFAKSSVLAKPLDMPSTLPSTFPPPAPAPAPGSLFGVSQTSPPQPVNDKENPFWEGEEKEKKREKDTSTPEIKITAPAVPPASSGFSFAPTSTPPSAAFSFSKPAPAMPAFGSVTRDVTNEPPKALSDAPAETAKQGFGTAPLTMPLFSPPVPPPPAESKLASGVSQPSTNSFGPVEPKPLFDSPKSAEKSAPAPSLFSFGPAAMTTVEALKPTFPASNSTPFTFGTPEKDETPKPSPFSFGAVPSTPPTNTVNGFSFKTDAPAASPSPVPFSFGATNPSPSNGAAKPFTFGATNSAIERPKTPENKDQEFRMEESPTRELQTSGSSKPSLSFSFGMPAANGSSSTLFNTVAPASPAATPSSPFSFGATTTPNPFGAPIKHEEPTRPGSFSFGNTSSTPTTAAPAFSFGPSKSTDPQRPNTAGSFGFGAPTPTSTAVPFSFGTGAAPPNPFAPAATSSAPSSPSAFNQPSPFSFNQPLPATSSTPFTFGSQPASPAGSSSGLPTIGGFGSTNGTFGAAPSSPFGSPAQLAPSTSSGGTLFTIGAAPTPQPPGGGPRQIRKLPSRRPGGAKPR